MKVLRMECLVRDDDVYDVTDELMHTLVNGGSLGGYVECHELDADYEQIFADTLQDLKDEERVLRSD